MEKKRSTFSARRSSTHPHAAHSKASPPRVLPQAGRPPHRSRQRPTVQQRVCYAEVSGHRTGRRTTESGSYKPAPEYFIGAQAPLLPRRQRTHLKVEESASKPGIRQVTTASVASLVTHTSGESNCRRLLPARPQPLWLCQGATWCQGLCPLVHKRSTFKVQLRRFQLYEALVQRRLVSVVRHINTVHHLDQSWPVFCEHVTLTDLGDKFVLSLVSLANHG